MLAIENPVNIQNFSPVFKSSHQRCSVRKGVLRNFAKFTGKYPCQSLFFNKVAGLRQSLKTIFYTSLIQFERLMKMLNLL